MSGTFDGEALRAAYLARLGSFFDAHASGDGTFQVLRFWTPNEPDAPMFQATFGASEGLFSNEVVLATAASFSPFRHAVEAAVRAGPDRAEPLAVVPCAIPDTRFEALLVLPPGVREPLAPFQIVRCKLYMSPFDAVILLPPEEGGLLLDDAGGEPIFALRAVPLTPMERRLAGIDLPRGSGRARAAPSRALAERGVLHGDDGNRSGACVPARPVQPRGAQSRQGRATPRLPP